MGFLGQLYRYCFESQENHLCISLQFFLKRRTPNSQRTQFVQSYCCGSLHKNRSYLHSLIRFFFSFCVLRTAESTSNYSVWQYPITERYGTIFKRMNEWGFTTSTADSLRHVRSGSVVFMESPLAAYYITSSCDLRQLGERIGSWHYGIALAPKSFLTPNFNAV